MTSSNIVIKEYHYPDEYVDTTMTAGGETGEDDLSAKDVLRYLVPFRRNRTDQDISGDIKYGQDINLSDYHLPDEYWDGFALNDNDMSANVQALSTRVIPFAWFRNAMEETSAPPPDMEISSNNMNLSDCHLSEDYIDSTHGAYNESSSEDRIIDSIRSFLGFEESEIERSNSLTLRERDLLDECIYPVMFASKKQVLSLDRLNEKIRKILSPNTHGSRMHPVASREKSKPYFGLNS